MDKVLVVRHNVNTRMKVRLWSCGDKVYVPDINSIILRLAPQAVIPISQRSFSVREGNVAMSISLDVNKPSGKKEKRKKKRKKSKRTSFKQFPQVQ
jgi:hypothetical protein